MNNVDLEHGDENSASAVGANVSKNADPAVQDNGEEQMPSSEKTATTNHLSEENSSQIQIQENGKTNEDSNDNEMPLINSAEFEETSGKSGNQEVDGDAGREMELPTSGEACGPISTNETHGKDESMDCDSSTIQESNADCNTDKCTDNASEEPMVDLEEKSPDRNQASSNKENEIETEQPLEILEKKSDKCVADAGLEHQTIEDTELKNGEETACEKEGEETACEKEGEGDVQTTLNEEKMEIGQSAENLESIKVDASVTEEKRKDKENESDSDEDKPQITIRNFAEIFERDSDEEEDIQEICFDQGAKASVAVEDSAEQLKTYSKKDKAIARLSEIATYDESLANLDMSAESDPIIEQVKRRVADRKVNRACTRLSMWLRRQVIDDKSENVSNAHSIAPPPLPQAVRQGQPRLPANPRESNSTVLTNMLQTVQQTYQQPPMTASQLVYGRGTPTATSTRPRQPVPPLSLISGSNTFAPGTTILAQPVTALWQTPGHQVVQRPNAPMQVRTSTTVTSTASVPRPATMASNITQPFTQLIYDPSSGYLLCPTNQNYQVNPQQQNTVPQQRGMSPSNALRFQNGMLIRPTDSSYNSVRQMVGNRNGLEISLSAGPQIANTQQRMQLQQQRPPAPVRSFAPVQQSPRQQINPRMSRPQGPMNPPVMHQNLASQMQQQINRSPVPVPQRGSSPRFPPIRPTSPQLQRPPPRTVSPQAQRPPIRPNGAPRVNGIPLPVAHTIPSSGPSTVPAEMGNVTAGNQKPIPGTVEESDTDLQNKTFPSLVVQVKTCLSTKPNRQVQTKARTELDAGVKAVLVHSPSKFTEWLMRRGLLKLAHYCDIHANQSFKLGMYSESSRQPFSGGYVWTSDCCPERQISVFSGSIFEGSKYPPGTVLKLMYHWSCQTPASNILQWVKVSSLYLKNFFTLLRAISISWMHENCPPMGGESKYVEIGVITLGSSAETSRGVKNVNVEILGVFDPATKIIRMKVINSMQGQLFKDKNKGGKPDAYEQGARAFQILWPLTHWVDKRSILLVDGIIDRALFQELGFKNIQQCSDSQRANASNMNVMNYLRNLVPKMFSSTLSVLSKSIVQQFLDELSWREMYGQTVLACFENLLDHISVMTKWDLRGESLITRLNKINQNPFVDWSYSKQTRRCPLNTVPLSLRNEPGIRECVRYVMKDEKKQPPPPPVYNPPSVAPTASSYVPPQKTAPKRKNTDQRDTVVANIAYYREVYETSPKIHSLQSYYYGSVRADDNPPFQPQRFPPNLKCPMCTRTFTSNVEICRHIYTHISSITYRGSENSVCRICLKELPVGVSMPQHMHVAHIMAGFNTACRICEEKFKTEQELVVHMWDLHQRRETPYKCGLCNYASSFHYYAVQHHQEKHGNEADVMCPFCLKIFSCASVGQLKLLINHLQAHAHLQRRVKKCPRCVLTFVSEVDLEIHLQEHRSQEPSAKWIPYLLPPNETNVKMALPPPTKTPLQVSIMHASVAALASAAPPAKKQKMNQYPAKKKQSTLNATLAVPIDTNEKFGGSKYKIVIPSTAQGLCAECGDDITKPNHFIGRLICSKCRYSTACQTAMDLHHERNHKPGSKSSKPGMKTKAVKSLNEAMVCKCGYASTHPTKLANHLISCDKFTVYPKFRKLASSAVSIGDPRSKSPTAQQAPALPDVPSVPPDVALSPLGLLGSEPVTTFADMLSLEESMASTLEALALPPLLSPSAPMPQSPLSVFDSSAGASSSNQPASQASQSGGINNTEASSSSWDTDAWELPLSGLIAKCKRNKS